MHVISYFAIDREQRRSERHSNDCTRRSEHHLPYTHHEPGIHFPKKQHTHKQRTALDAQDPGPGQANTERNTRPS